MKYITQIIILSLLFFSNVSAENRDNELVNEAVVEMIETQLEDNQETYQQLLKPVIDKVDDDDLDKIISYFNPELIIESIQSKIMDNERELLTIFSSPIIIKMTSPFSAEVKLLISWKFFSL